MGYNLSELASPLDRFFGYLVSSVLTGNITDVGVEYHKVWPEILPVISDGAEILCHQQWGMLDVHVCNSRNS